MLTRAKLLAVLVNRCQRTIMLPLRPLSSLIVTGLGPEDLDRTNSISPNCLDVVVCWFHLG